LKFGYQLIIATEFIESDVNYNRQLYQKRENAADIRLLNEFEFIFLEFGPGSGRAAFIYLSEFGRVKKVKQEGSKPMRCYVF